MRLRLFEKFWTRRFWTRRFWTRRKPLKPVIAEISEPQFIGLATTNILKRAQYHKQNTGPEVRAFLADFLGKIFNAKEEYNADHLDGTLTLRSFEPYAFALALYHFERIIKTDIKGARPAYQVFFVCLMLADKYLSDDAHSETLNSQFYFKVYSKAACIPPAYQNDLGLKSFNVTEMNVFKALGYDLQRLPVATPQDFARP